MRTIDRKPTVRHKTGLSDSTIWRLEKNERFPRRVQVTEAGAVGWYSDEIDAWVHERVRGSGKRPPRANQRGHGTPAMTGPDLPAGSDPHVWHLSDGSVIELFPDGNGQWMVDHVSPGEIERAPIISKVTKREAEEAALQRLLKWEYRRGAS
jgi:predicted DNA-binding transcriptional regulator AlpA